MKSTAELLISLPASFGIFGRLKSAYHSLLRLCEPAGSIDHSCISGSQLCLHVRMGCNLGYARVAVRIWGSVTHAECLRPVVPRDLARVYVLPPA